MKKQTKMWTMSTGKKIRICDMTDSHLLNTIKLLERTTERANARALSSAYNAFGMFNGHLAQWTIEDTIDTLENHPPEPHEVYPIYENLCEEASRRGILNKTLEG